MDVMADGEAEINFEALEMAQQEEEPEFNFADTTALLKIQLPLTLPQFMALLIKTISTLTRMQQIQINFPTVFDDR
jgi:hypothetical protein